MKLCTTLTFNIEKEIGAEGKNSKVFLAYDPQLDARIVVKAIPKEDFLDQDQFFSESQNLYLTQHPNIVQIQYACQDNANIYLSMPFYREGSLNSLINKRFLTVREIIKYSLEFLSGLHFMHTKRLVHFDIKPTNILLSNSGKALVTDFGLSKFVNERGFATPDKIYSLHRPPEAFVTPNLTSLFDVYQSGMTLYRMCNGNDDFYEQLNNLVIKSQEDLIRSIKSEKFPNRKRFLPHIPIKLQRVIKKSISPDPISRQEAILDVINEISNIEQNLDWVYNIDANTCSEYWTLDKGEYSEQIKLSFHSGNYIVRGTKIRKDDLRTTSINKWKSDKHESKISAYKEIASFIADA